MSAREETGKKNFHTGMNMYHRDVNMENSTMHYSVVRPDQLFQQVDGISANGSTAFCSPGTFGQQVTHVMHTKVATLV